MAVLSAIRKFVIREVLKDSPKGVLQTLPNKDLVELNVQVIAQRLMQEGIDPTKLKNANQVENAIKMIESRANVQTGFTTKKSADVFDLEGKKIDTSKGIMGGKQFDDLPPGDDDLPPPGSRGGADDIAAPFQSAEESIKNMIEAENRKNISKIKKRKMVDDAIDNMSPSLSGDTRTDAALVAEDMAERMGKVYDDLSSKERLDLYDEAYTALSKIRFKGMKKPKDDPEDMAQGGRAGFANGTGAPSITLGPKDKPMGPRFETNDPGEAAKEIIKRLIPIQGAQIPLTEKGLLSLNIDNLDKQSLGGIIDLLGGELQFGVGRDEEGRGAGFTFKKQFADGGRIGFSKGSGLKTILNFLNENNPVQAYKKYLESIKTRMKQGKEAEVAGEVIPIAAGGALITNQMKKVLKKMNEEQKKRIEEEAQEELRKDMKKADGGRIGLKDGMDRRTFMKIMAGLTALPVLGKFFKGAKVASKAAPIIKTPNAPGKPEWFDALVTKVVNEGTDVTKGFATKERELVHTKQINDFAEVTVYRDLDTNTTIVNYGSKLRRDPTKPYEKGNIERAVNDPDQIDLVVKGAEDVEPTIIENERGFVRRRGTKSSAEFEAYESEPRVVNYDGDMEFDGTNVVNNVDDLKEDVSVLKEYATGKKLTPEEAAKAKKKREDYQKFLEDPVEQANYLESKYGPGPEPDDYASGGIARMLGE